MLEKLPSGAGRALRGQRAGLDMIALRNVGLKPEAIMINLESPAFASEQPLPVRFTADGEGLSPPLFWSGVPAQTTSLVLLVEDPDAPTPHPFVHAIVVDLPPELNALADGALASGGRYHQGKNSYLRAEWLPPDPPSGHGVHRYVFQLFALASGPEFPERPGVTQVLDQLTERALAGGYLIGTYERP